MTSGEGTSSPRWHLVGEWFDVCRCTIPCPCEFAQPPTDGWCEGILAYHIREGQYGDVQLDGLNMLLIGHFEGNLWTNETTDLKLGFFLDERASDEQRQAILTIFGGQAGGVPAQLGALWGQPEVLGVETAPITFDVAEDLSSWRAEIPGKVIARAEALSGPTTPPGQRVQTLNPPGAEVGPGGAATWGRAITDRVTDVFGVTFEWDGRSSKHIPFEWSGPDAA